MKQIHTEIEIDAPAERVWAVLADLDGYAQWNPLIRRASGTLVQGGRLQLFISTPGLASRDVGVEVLRVEPGRELRWLGRLFMPGLLDGDHAFAIEPLGQGRCRLVQRETFRGLLVPFVTPWLMPNMTAGFEAMNGAVKARVEATLLG